MWLPEKVAGWLVDQGYGEVVASQPTGGGCINNGAVLRTSSGSTFFLKTNPRAPQDMFARESEGLSALAVPGAPRVPKPYLWGSDFLLLEDLSPAERSPDYWPAFGRQLALLHKVTQDKFGFGHDNYIGSTPQPNRWMADGYAFFAEQRLVFQARMAQSRNLLNREEARQVEKLAGNLRALVPAQPASLIHGDLWSGNALTDERGQPALIDPAAHFGWAEAELAMTALFGAFPVEFYRAYQEVRLLEGDYRQRFPIYNLYHLLNHLNLFGGGYRSQVNSILRRYS